MQPLPEHLMPAKSYQRKQYAQDRRKPPREGLRNAAEPRGPEPFGPAYGCVEWFMYEESAQGQPANI
ncbi:MAG TPA: hypothetical protein VFY39_06255 [Gammaproteobacteria bacterium]|nr:hypothetical protein [Gammaproteobacteria bacterium]